MARPRPRFAVDGMAVRLGRYLRCLGYDATWDVALPTRILARRAEVQGRVLVTRNARIGEELHVPGPLVRLASEASLEQLRQVREELELDATHAFTRCLACNVALEPADASLVEARVPARVLASHAAFTSCPSCARVYWLGGHVARTCALLGIPAPPGTRA